jgi:cellulose synthase operon protein YhjU
MNMPLEPASVGHDVRLGGSASVSYLLRAPSFSLAPPELSPVEAEAPARTALAPVPRLGWWNFYFLAKFVLFWRELIGLHPLENLAFAAFLLVPLRLPFWRRARSIAAVPIGIAVLYYDSWLPPIGRVMSQVSLLSHFSITYLGELAGRFFSWPIVATLVIAATAYRFIAMRVRVGVIVVIALSVLSIVHSPAGVPGSARVALSPARSGAASEQPTGSGQGDMDSRLRDHYSKEAQRSVTFSKPSEQAVPFDVVFLHVCSLSWDDLQAMGLENHPLWKRFDIVLSRFNSGASYSGPAAIRMLRAPCGQTSHTDLYSPAAANCYLMPNLKQAGFDTNLLLNHDGHFDDFIGVVRRQGNQASSALPLTGIPVAQRAFDDSPIYDDLAVLSRWLDSRKANQAPRVAAYFNTVSLHDGNRLTGADSKRSSTQTYKIRLAKLLDDLDQFMTKLETDGRRAVVVMVPEHGAAIRGDKMQVAGLREIPSPAITLVPVGVKVIGPEARRSADVLRIDTPTSYLAVSHIVARMLEKSPFSPGGFTPSDYVDELPASEFVAENAGMLTMHQGDRYVLRMDKEGWTEYPASVKQ